MEGRCGLHFYLASIYSVNLILALPNVSREEMETIDSDENCYLNIKYVRSIGHKICSNPRIEHGVIWGLGINRTGSHGRRKMEK